MANKLKTLNILFLLLTTFYVAFALRDIPCETHNAQGTKITECPDLYTCVEGYCKHKDIFPLTFREVVGSIFLMFLAGLANSGGLGGGALLSPVLLLFFNYDPNKAIMIVYSIVFGGSLGNFLNVALQKNPATGRSYVDYDLSLICMPLMTLGANVGVLLNRVFPPFLVIVGLTLVIIYTGKKVWARANLRYSEETEQQEKALLDVDQPRPSKDKRDFEMSLLSGSNRDSSILNRDSSKSNRYSSMPSELKEILQEEKELFPKRKIFMILLMLSFVIFMMILKGSKDYGSPIGLEYCETGYWMVFLLSLAGCYAFYLKGLQMVNQNLAIKRQYRFRPDGNEFYLTPEIVNRFGMLSFIAGISAGLLGLGGGMVMSPLLLQFGMGPQVLAATVGFFVVQTSFVTLFQSFYYGDVTGTETMFFLVISFFGSFGVSYGLNYMVKKYNRPSLILFALSFVLLLSFIVMPVFGVYKSIDNPDLMFVFHSLC